MRKLNSEEIKDMAISLYMTEEQAKETMEKFFELKEKNDYRMDVYDLDSLSDYTREWECNWYRYDTFEKLVESEKEQGTYGFTEAECKEQIGKSIFLLKCGLYIQTVR